jgi:hypothetical protein
MIKSQNADVNIPVLRVEFRLDVNGNPMLINKDSVNHYKIRISIDNIPADVYAVNYQLHPSYISPFREERNRANSFGFNTTTYGDYIISAELMGKKGNQIISTLVSESLDRNHMQKNKLIAEALKNIKEA